MQKDQRFTIQLLWGNSAGIYGNQISMELYNDCFFSIEIDYSLIENGINGVHTANNQSVTFGTIY
jgi:hypothetical protein